MLVFFCFGKLGGKMIRKTVTRDIKINPRERVSIDLPLTLYSQDVSNTRIELNLKDENGLSLNAETVKTVIVNEVLTVSGVDCSIFNMSLDVNDNGTIIMDNLGGFNQLYLKSGDGVVALNLYIVDNDKGITDVGEVRYKVKQSNIDNHCILKNSDEIVTEVVTDASLAKGELIVEEGEAEDKLKLFRHEYLGMYPDLTIVFNEGKNKVIRTGPM